MDTIGQSSRPYNMRSWEHQLCGQGENFSVWLHTDFGHCFEQMTFICLSHVLLAIVSVFYAAQWRRSCVMFHRRHWYLYARMAVSFLLLVTAMLQLMLTRSLMHKPLSLVNVCTCSVVMATWLLHVIYVYRLQSMYWFSVRGPLSINLFVIAVAAATVVKAYSEALLRIHHHLFYNVIEEILTYVTLALLSLYLLTLIPRESHDPATVESQETDRLLVRSPASAVVLKQGECGNFFSRLVFHWVTPLMVKGSKGEIHTAGDLFQLPKRVNVLNIEDLFREILETEIKSAQNARDKCHPPAAENLFEESMHTFNDTIQVSFSDENTRRQKKTVSPHKHSLLRALHKAFGKEYYLLGLLKLTADIVGFFGPILLNRLVSYMENPHEKDQNGYWYALGLFLSTLVGSLCTAHFGYRVAFVAYKVRIAVISTIYRKTVHVNSLRMSKFTSGEIVNFMSTDSTRIVGFCPSFHNLWSLPFQIGVSLYLLYQQVGISFLAGLGFAVVLIPINKCLATKIGQLSKRMMAYKDERVEIMNEILRGIRVIKLYAWEEHFKSQVNVIRENELRQLRGRKYLDALCVYFWATTPVLISILTFTTYSLLGNELTAAKVFTSLALFLMLISPLNAFPWVLNGVIEAWVSLKRVQSFVDLPILTGMLITAQIISQVNILYDGTYSGEVEDIQISNGCFTWKPRLPGDRSEEEEVEQPNTLDLCDISLEVNQGAFVGVCSRVGGGKSSLLSAILGEMGRVAGCISVSCLDDGFALVAQEPWLQHATIRDNILFGREMNLQQYERVVTACALREDFQILKDGDMTEIGEQGVTLSGGQKSRIAFARAVYQDKQVYLMDDPLAAVDAHVSQHLFQKCIMGVLRHKTRILCTHHVKFLQQADLVIVMEHGRIVKSGTPQEILHKLDITPDLVVTGDTPATTHSADDDPDTTTSPLIKEEEKDVGMVKSKVYKTYYRMVGHCLAPTILISLFLMQASRNINDWWLSFWVTHSYKHPNSTLTNSSFVPLTFLSFREDDVIPYSNMTEPSDNVAFYLMVYGILAASNSVFTLFRAFLFAYGGIKAAQLIHKDLLASILSATVSFFDETPIGRILNRFSSDIYAIDDSLPFTLNIFLMQVYCIVGTVAITCYGLPWFAVLLIPLSAVYYFIQRYYRHTSREIKRISSVTLSPIYAHFSESIAGLTTIRAFRSANRFMSENLARLELNLRAQFSGKSAVSWLNLRLQMLGVVMVTGVALIAVVEHHFQTVNPGLVGLAISYALSITNLLNGVVMFFTETEKQMISVERAQQFIDDVPKEHSHPSAFMAPPQWPTHGAVRFHRVFLCYRPGLPYALNSVSFLIAGGEKIGVVGRTGSGKSSLLVALLRMVEVERGEIEVDDVGVTWVPLATLRSSIATIPQDPFLFTGTIRANLDPTSSYHDDELFLVLEKCHLGEPVTQLGGLDAQVAERGRLFSVGQRQLMCLARALLKKSMVLCIDEATASVDIQTASLIQDTLHQQFTNSTVITIAHRIESILDSDRVLVMSNGKVAEFDSPDILLQDPSSMFYGLVHGHNR